jgi:SAM-dependent methyltransferase
VAYAGARFWDQYFRELRQTGNDLDWEGLWTGPFLAPLREAAARTILELGCGTGNDAARLAREGYSVTAVDLSAEAIARAQARFGPGVSFLIADVALPLPFPDCSFDAVMSNVALHMFPDSVTRSVFAEVRRLVRPGGLFLFHVNALEDRPLRARWRPVARELEQDFVLEESGQTMHFFSEPYLRELLKEWSDLRLDLIEITHRETGEKFKQVWRGVAHRPTEFSPGGDNG